MNIDYERQNIFFVLCTNMFVQFLSFLFACLRLSLFPFLSAWLTMSCSNRMVDKIKSLQPTEIRTPLIDLNETGETYYPLSQLNPDGISDVTFAFLFIVSCCLIFTFPGLLLYIVNNVTSFFKRKK